MINILINGCNGKMGQIVCDLVHKSDDMNLIAGVDIFTNNSSFPIYSSFDLIKDNIDVIIDFSIPSATFKALDYAIKTKTPIVIATTGFSEEETQKINELSKKIAIFKSANMSFDINIMIKLLEWLAPLLQNTDIEILETHHNRKVDAPSGTAKMLADCINNALKNTYHYEYNRHDKHEKRNKNEIGISSIRGGNIVGEHSVQFFSEYETLEIKHTSYSRNIFAEGAIKAARFLINKPAGLYNMKNLT